MKDRKPELIEAINADIPSRLDWHVRAPAFRPCFIRTVVLQLKDIRFSLGTNRLQRLRKTWNAPIGTSFIFVSEYHSSKRRSIGFQGCT